MEDVSTLIKLASRITVFIYNHKWPLKWLRKRPNWTEIIRPGATRFGTSFIALKSLHDHKYDLQALVTSVDFKNMLKVTKTSDVKQTILDEKFWDNCFITVQVMSPILRLLRICDSDKKPSLGYFYEGMLRIRKGVKEFFKRKRHYYKWYVDIIDARWDKMLCKSLHEVAYWPISIFEYEKDNREEKQKAWDKVGTFGRSIAMSSVELERPEEWWKAFGGDVPALQKFAIRILSQSASSSGCERNWSVFVRIHTKRRNRLENQRLGDLVYVHYNLYLQNRLNESKRPYDPVDYQSVDKNEFWVVEDENESELNYDDLENMLDEELPINLNSQTQPSEGQEFNEEDNVVQVDDVISFDDGDFDDDDDSDSLDDW
ncbi:uncharacterized protein LOC110876294 [Helianthus annuus]|uniref:uncharacterized protein LOC110876294 n=1 Tax=Helianthus annuus TaxID=4232 RepID=UPI000B8FCE2E|nr:uncharacterized protein LOC110876294 [Helianthus annuus]